jgi:hypothetical protein
MNAVFESPSVSLAKFETLSSLPGTLMVSKTPRQTLPDPAPSSPGFAAEVPAG